MHDKMVRQAHDIRTEIYIQDCMVRLFCASGEAHIASAVLAYSQILKCSGAVQVLLVTPLRTIRSLFVPRERHTAPRVRMLYLNGA
jgi:hypothetical protein